MGNTVNQVMLTSRAALRRIFILSAPNIVEVPMEETQNLVVSHAVNDGMQNICNGNYCYLYVRSLKAKRVHDNIYSHLGRSLLYAIGKKFP